MLGLHLRRAPVLAACLALAACGARTGQPGDDTGDTGDTDDPPGHAPDPREGSCDNPIPLPFANFEVRGRLAGPGKVEGYCGDGENDGGPEDSYKIVPDFNTDVLVFVMPDTEFTPSLRVTREGCWEDDGVIPQLCAAPVGDVPYQHFFVEAGREYNLTIDSPEGTDGTYTMQLFYGPPEISQCPVHSTMIDQHPGGYFTWSNDLGGRPGRVGGACGGPGIENMFQVNVNYPGLITFRLTADESFDPVLSVRSGCGGSSELTCTSAEATGSPIVEVSWFFDPGTYYVVVDQNDIEGGEYLLEAFIE